MKQLNNTTKTNKISSFAKKIIMTKYALEQEKEPQEIFKRTADHYSKNRIHARRIYNYMKRSWFIPSSPALYCAAAKQKRGLPISCYMNEIEDNFYSINKNWNEVSNILHNGGGVGTLWSKIRCAGSKVGIRGITSGIIPLLKVVDAITTAVNSTSRRGNVSVYLDVDHPEILEFINMRNPFGGDPSRKCHHIHHAVILSDKFMEAVEKNLPWQLKNHNDGVVVKEVGAREIMEAIMLSRHSTGEPYIVFKDRVEESTPEHHKRLNLFAKASNLCTEIVLPTGLDHRGLERTAICCLSSVNLEHYDSWKNHPTFIEDAMLFLDGVLDCFIEGAEGISALRGAVYSAKSERSVGLGVMGLHSYAQQKFLPFESEAFRKINREIFEHIHTKTCEASKKFADLYGSCLDAEETGIKERFTYKTAIAPTANISLVFETSPGIEPYGSNAYVLAGSYGTKVFKNKNLDKLIRRKFDNPDEIWNKIVRKDGSILELDEFSPHEKAVYKTAYEMDQNVIIDMASERKVCQSQSLNIFFNHNVNKKTITEVHMNAAKKVKTLYYCKTKSAFTSSLTRIEDLFKEYKCESCSS